jgi:hypothetical protein
MKKPPKGKKFFLFVVVPESISRQRKFCQAILQHLASGMSAVEFNAASSSQLTTNHNASSTTATTEAGSSSKITQRGTQLKLSINPFGSQMSRESIDTISSRMTETNATQGESNPQALQDVVTQLLKVNAEMADRMSSMEKALVTQMSGAPTTGVSLATAQYKFHPKIEEEMLRHPKAHSFYTSEDFKAQMQAIPQLAKQAVVTTCEDTALTSKLRGETRTKFFAWLPAQESMWANQLRIAGYMYDVLLKTKEMSYFQEVLAAFPDFEDIFSVAEFNFYAITGARRN